MKVVHFLGKVKPWSYSYDAQRGEVRGQSDPCQLHPDYLLQWWQLYAKSVLPLLQTAYGDTPFSSGFVDDKRHEGATEQTASPLPPPSPPQVTSAERKQRWEEGQIDYMGADSFANIERKLDSFLK